MTNQLTAFAEAIKTDSGLQEQLKIATNSKSIVEIAKAAGFAISTEDLATPFMAFAEAVKTDSGLRDRLNSAADSKSVVEIAKAAGFAISTEDIESAIEMSEDISVELSDEDLANVSGGGGFGVLLGYGIALLYWGIRQACD